MSCGCQANSDSCPSFTQDGMNDLERAYLMASNDIVLENNTSSKNCFGTEKKTLPLSVFDNSSPVLGKRKEMTGIEKRTIHTVDNKNQGIMTNELKENQNTDQPRENNGVLKQQTEVCSMSHTSVCCEEQNSKEEMKKLEENEKISGNQTQTTSTSIEEDVSMNEEDFEEDFKELAQSEVHLFEQASSIFLTASNNIKLKKESGITKDELEVVKRACDVLGSGIEESSINQEELDKIFLQSDSTMSNSSEDYQYHKKREEKKPKRNHGLKRVKRVISIHNILQPH
ncbi:hypothetical protein EHI8A_060940 [Entamoeba histolytica HM-1:IMSS-B]|uniref:Uncharacterized protein n=5 Tax=Entamoeba histolytica TaxID=5759 RepID=C4M4S0_ENTH1|nr:hypothetical protein EHI_095070 [Entamoeba histolytica HM-1:IMSS]EMD47615.1 Hypothetical protein EHI5A_172140 [Entamoeba histolytica KU27]EMH77342.1 hypothetical protein EHI8A_060940 [Entamoeba histolytica HM-1:IMSS-B]ENY65652.1 hypothetical protein EHI7A_058760 [Entamoeba histolytica HM-1:IMSS-A]GAT96376.1 hypothetical protein CL6EHI_095070 [Entamoeba histolytica]EAL44420.1 hypothetical protein EHI_095070 [Entamoeba histolytica HM-1:IMSS]|eukprot:XP_649808.1 hypothetical protein EHI_095070 [Entamoeba histolytica HM-1:IMSS]